jgi:hypothetical protein
MPALLAGVLIFSGCRQPTGGSLYPKVDQVEIVLLSNIDPQDVHRGIEVMLQANVTAREGASKAVTWTVENWGSEATIIETVTADTARLTIPIDEYTEVLYVWAVSDFDYTKSASLELTLSQIVKAELDKAISEANDAIKDIPVSVNGSEVPVGVKWVTQQALAAFKEAIADAVYTSNQNPSGAQIMAAAAALKIAKDYFIASQAVGTKLNKEPLSIAISAAEALESSTVVNTAASNVNKGTWWVTQGVKDAFAEEIKTAKDVWSTPDTQLIQADVNAAQETLLEKTAIFMAARKDGSLVPQVDKTGLYNAISAAKALLDNTQAAANATTVDEGKFWVTAPTYNAFNALISESMTVSTLPTYTQAQVNAQTYKLAGDPSAEPGSEAFKGATAVFDAQRHEGTRVVKTGLINALDQAKSASNNVRTSVDGADVPVGTSWVTSVVAAEFATAILTAEGVSTSSTARQADVDAAADTLWGKIDIYNTAKQNGFLVGLADISALNNAVNLATTNLASVSAKADSLTPESAAAVQVPTGSQWVYQAAYDTFNSAINTAKALLITPPPANQQSDVAAAVGVLNTAGGTFNAAKKDGTLATAVSRDTLGTAISQARTTRATAVVATANNEVDSGGQWVTQAEMSALTAAITAAEDKQNTLYISQADISDATNSLAAPTTGAIAVFIAARNGHGPGTKQVAVDKTGLNNAINAAETMMNSAVVNDAAADRVTDGVLWVTSGERGALNNAITAAKIVYNDQASTSVGVNEQLRLLNGDGTDLGAIKIFENARKVGTGATPAAKNSLNAAISAANNAKNTATVSDAAYKVPFGSYWVTQGAQNVLSNAISDAQSVSGADYPTQAAVISSTNSLATPVTGAIAVFEAARATGTQATAEDKAALSAAITTAGAAKADAAVSVTETGTDVPSTMYWVTQAEMDALNTAIAAAQALVSPPNISRADVTNAIASVGSATTVFNTAKEGHGHGTSVLAADKIALGNVISEANTLKNTTVVSDAANKVTNGARWVTQGVQDDLTYEIGLAEAVRANADAIQADVNAAVTSLTSAIGIFNGSRGTGTQATATAKSDLNAAIANANTAKGAVGVSDAANKVPVGSYWVTQAAQDALTGAISAAQIIHANAYATQAEATGAENSLTTPDTGAIAVFNAAKQEGTQALPAHKAALAAAISQAESARTTNVAVSALGDGTDVSKNLKWVTQAEMDALNAAISNAQAIYSNENATQAEAAGATASLGTSTTGAIGAFNTARDDHGVGTGSSRNELISVWQDALRAQNSATVNTAAENVKNGNYWVTQEAWTTFETAINAAETVINNQAADQPAINTAVTNLAGATATFNAARQLGTQATAEHKESLIEAISAATEAKTGVLQAENGNNIENDRYWVTAAVMDALNSAIANATVIRNTQAVSVAAVAEGITALNNAVTAFNAAKTQGLLIFINALNAGISAANDAKSGIVVYDAATNVVLPAGTRWVAAATGGQNALDVLNTAISNATGVRDAPLSQSAVDTEVATLSAAVAAFNAAVHIKANTNALDGFIASAEAARNGVLSLTEAESHNHYNTVKWVTPAEMSAFNGLINTAKTVGGNAASLQEAVDIQAQTLSAATSVFVSQTIKKGQKNAAGVLTINFDQPGYETIDLTRQIQNSSNQWVDAPEEQEISKTAGTLRITLNGDISLRFWMVDGFNQYTASRSLDVMTFGLSAGYHSVTAVVQVNGLIYSKVIFFKIGN